MALIEIQVIASGGSPPEGQPYYFVDRAIEAIKDSGLKYEVEPLGTTIEGEFEAAMATAIRAHLAPLEAGADGVLTIIKIAQRRQDRTTMQELVAKHRPSGG
jgi:uncharacterized protein (TIGR00106 family)